jgi:hypothetical protein
MRIEQPLRQHQLRATAPQRAEPRAANTPEHRAQLAHRLTARDLWIAAMLHEHRVLTSDHITTLAFPSYRSGRLRLRELWLWSLIDRFRPHTRVGTAPHHYTLAPAGAEILANHHGHATGRDIGYQRDTALAVAHSLQLAHTVGVNHWFTTLAATARHHGHPGVIAWWSERRCAAHFGDLVRPDAYGRYTTGDGEGTVEFFLEFDLATETPDKLARKLDGYHQLATTTGITTPVLVWLPTSQREATARRALADAWQHLDHPHRVPVATAAAAALLDPDQPQRSPAQAVWLPLDQQHTQRCTLPALAHTWIQHSLPGRGGRPAAAATTPAPTSGTSPRLVLPPPPATPPMPRKGR